MQITTPNSTSSQIFMVRFQYAIFSLKICSLKVSFQKTVLSVGLEKSSTQRTSNQLHRINTTIKTSPLSTLNLGAGTPVSVSHSVPHSLSRISMNPRSREDDNASIASVESEPHAKAVASLPPSSGQQSLWQSKLRSRLLFSNKESALSHSLSRIRALALAATVFVALVAIFQFLTLNWTFAGFASTLSWLAAAARRRSQCVGAVSLTHDLVLQNAGLQGANVASVQTKLANVVSSLKQSHTDLYVNRAMSLSAAQLSLFSGQPFQAVQLQTQSASITYSVISIYLNELMQKLFSSLLRLSSAPLSGLSMSDPDVFFVLSNAASVVLPAIGSSTEAYVQDAVSSVDQMRWINLSFVIVPIVVFVLVLMHIMSSISAVECHKNGLIRFF
jgi:hypothetical protein